MLYDWLYMVKKVFNLKDITLCLAIYILNRFLSFKQIESKNIILCSVGCFIIASQVIEIYPPLLYKWSQLTSYTIESIEKMNHIILITLNFDLEMPKFGSTDLLSIFLYFLTFYVSELCFEYSHFQLLKACQTASLMVQKQEYDMNSEVQNIVKTLRYHASLFDDVLSKSEYKDELGEWFEIE